VKFILVYPAEQHERLLDALNMAARLAPGSLEGIAIGPRGLERLTRDVMRWRPTGEGRREIDTDASGVAALVCGLHVIGSQREGWARTARHRLHDALRLDAVRALARLDGEDGVRVELCVS